MPILHYDYSALIVLLVIIFSMVNRRVIKGHTNRTFFFVLILSFAATVADIFSTSPVFAVNFRYFMSYAYYILNILVPYFYITYVYSSAGLSHHYSQTKKVRIRLAIPFVIFMGLLIANIFTGCTFYFDEAGNYCRGPLQLALIGLIGLYNIIGICIIIYWRKILPKMKIVFLVSFFPILFLAVFAQQAHQHLSISMFGLAISLLIISFSVQRHDENLDKLTGLKNFDSAMDDFHKILITNQNVHVIFIKIKNQYSIRQFLGTTAYTKFKQNFVTEINNRIKNYPCNIEIYYTHEGVYEISVDTTDSELVSKIADELFRRFRIPFLYENVSVIVDAAICIAKFPDELPTVDKLMNFRLVFFNMFPSLPLVYKLADFKDSKEFQIKNEIVDIINKALENKNFKMYYQPIYSVKEKKFVSAEALIRLNDPEHGFVSPAIFIPEAEKNGTIHQIGDYVFDSVFNFIANHDYKSLGLEYIELNLSVTQCMEPDLVDKLKYLMHKYEVSPKQINLEITETAEGFDPYIMDKNIYQLSQNGLKFSLDDYGTGYSNIKRVTTLPLDIVKLDKSFVDEMDNPQMWSVIVNTVKMFKEMHKTILVEGVENEKTFNALVDLGCEYIQGYYFSKPIPEDDFVKFLEEHNK
ncbi:EAL domain-containing protein [Treponema sp.]|uniref:EAL domain-containing protein n=1 Tax=Treponema sp. TaxID=166 RepID=UPI00298E2BD2|nr:EAL domain-containing protein [Treponema sp.]MCQ2242335.1 EAL domain-containing protein [Treponema sp.]